MQCDSMAFGAIALAIVGSSWCLTGAILGRAPKDGLDTGMVQLGSSVVSIVAGIILGALLLPPSPVGGKVLAATLGTYALAGSLNFAALQAMAVGMQRGPNGRVWGIMQSAQLFSFLGGVVFFGDPLTPPRIVGMAFLVAAIALFAIAKDEGPAPGKPAASRSGAGWRFWAFLSLAICAVQQNLAAAPSHFEQARSVSPLLRAIAASTGTLCPAVAMLLAGAARDKAAFLRKVPSLARGRLWLYALGMQFFGLLFAYTLFYPGLDILARHGLGGMGYPLMVGACIVAFTFSSLVFLKEKLRARQLAAIALCVIGLVLLCWK